MQRNSPLSPEVFREGGITIILAFLGQCMGVFTGQSHVDELPISDRQALNSFSQTALLRNTQCLFNKDLQRSSNDSPEIFPGKRRKQQQLFWTSTIFPTRNFKRGIYVEMEIFLTHSRMKLLMDQSCTVVHHHHYHRTPTWNCRKKEKLKPFLLPTHTELETTLAWVSYTPSGAKLLLSCYYWAICFTTAPARCQTHFTDQ